MNCRFDSFELDTLFFFWKSNAYISLSMSGSVAGSIPCMSANKLHWVQAEDTYIASNFTDLICEYTTTPCLIGVGSKSAANKLLQKRNIPMPMKGIIVESD